MKKQNKMIGKYVIVRSHLAGVFFGILSEKNGTELTLTNARKFYYYSGANTVEDIADKGALNVKNCKVTIEVEEIVISDFVQILPCTEKAVEQIKTIPAWKF